MPKHWRVYQIGDDGQDPIYMVTDGRDQHVGGQWDDDWRLVGKLDDSPEAVKQMISDPTLDAYNQVRGSGFVTASSKQVWPGWKPKRD